MGGVAKRASDPTKKRACCKWEHSLSAAQLVEHAQAKFPEKHFSTRPLLRLAKRFMTDNMGAAPLGTPHARQSPDYQVPLYGGSPLKAVKPDGTIAGRDGAKHYYVYMGYRWQGTSPGSGSSSGPNLTGDMDE